MATFLYHLLLLLRHICWKLRKREKKMMESHFFPSSFSHSFSFWCRFFFIYQWKIYRKSRWTFRARLYRTVPSSVSMFTVRSIRASWHSCTFHINYSANDEYSYDCAQKQMRNWNGIANILQFINFFMAMLFYTRMWKYFLIVLRTGFFFDALT